MKLKLDMDDLTDDFFEDARLLGIVAPIKNYQFCWQLNTRLRFDFRINNDLEIQLSKKQRVYYFNVYAYAEKNNSLTHYLYTNSFDGEYLLPEFRHLDYLWLLKGDVVAEEMIRELMNSIKSIPGVQLVMELVRDKIKHKAHLVF